MTRQGIAIDDENFLRIYHRLSRLTKKPPQTYKWVMRQLVANLSLVLSTEELLDNIDYMQQVQKAYR